MPRRHPPHRTDCPYHLTARVNNRESFGLDLSEVWKIYEEQLYFVHHAFGLRTHAFVLMSNHFHLLLSDPDGQMSPGLRWLMTETARQINRRTNHRNHLYGDRNHRSLISSYHYYRNAYKYVYRNPVEVSASLQVETYPYSTIQGLLGFQKLNFPVFDNLLTDDLEGVLSWLNTPGTRKDQEEIRQALRKTEFELRVDPVGRKPSRLETELY